MHLFYVLILFVYIQNTYIFGNNDAMKDVLEKMLIIAVIYPAWYDTA